MTSSSAPVLPIIDISPLLKPDASPAAIDAVDNGIGRACTETGFFYIVGHGIPVDLQQALHSSSQKFFSLDVALKKKVAMALGGKAWRGTSMCTAACRLLAFLRRACDVTLAAGWFPLGDELTSGRPDQKEGFYLGSEDGESPLPLHGSNLWPEEVPELRPVVEKYMSHCCNLGQVLMQSLVRYLRVDASVFMVRATASPNFANQLKLNLQGQFENPTTLFRLFNYPPHPDVDDDGLPLFGVGEHTDYGYLTLLLQDNSGGLQVKHADGSWIDAPPVDGSLVVNLGDALEHNTGCLIKATPHRVRHTSSSNRMSFPFFFDPSFSKRMESVVSQLPEGETSNEYLHRAFRHLSSKHSAIEPAIERGDSSTNTFIRNMTIGRWDDSRPEMFEGQYGVYLMKKVSKVFPELASDYIKGQEGM